MRRFVVCGETLIDLVPSDQGCRGLAQVDLAGPLRRRPDELRGCAGQAGHGHPLPRPAVQRTRSDGSSASTSSAPTSSWIWPPSPPRPPRSRWSAWTPRAWRATRSTSTTRRTSAGRSTTCPQLPETDWLHIASLSCVVSPGAEVLLEWMRDVTAGVSYDINVRPTVITDPEIYWAKVQPWLRVLGQRNGIVKASDEDIKFLAKAAGQSGPGAVRPDRGGARLGRPVRAEHGGDHARSGRWDRHRTWWQRDQGCPDSRPRWSDTVGAGDTFMAGFLDGPGQARELNLEDSPAASGRRGVDRLLAPGRSTADLGRGG